MKITASLVLFAAALLAQPALAQKWVVFSPQERDFRVLFPSDPVEAQGSDGTVSFRAQDAAGSRPIDYVVHRLPANVQPTGNEEQDIQRILQARLGDKRLTPVKVEDPTSEWPRYAFEHGIMTSVNRLVAAGGRTYHLEVVTTKGRIQHAMPTARDFFASFEAGGAAIPGLRAGAAQKIDTWCQGRTDVFSRTFCEYSTCIQPGFEQNPKCAGLLKR